ECGRGGADDRDRLVVAALAEPEPAVLLRDLDAERAQSAETIDHVVGDLPRPLDLLAVDRLRELVELAVEFRSPLLLAGIPWRRRVDQVEAEPSQEELTDEARHDPLGLTRRLGNLAGLLFIDGTRACRGCRRPLGRAHRRPPDGRRRIPAPTPH